MKLQEARMWLERLPPGADTLMWCLKTSHPCFHYVVCVQHGVDVLILRLHFIPDTSQTVFVSANVKPYVDAASHISAAVRQANTPVPTVYDVEEILRMLERIPLTMPTKYYERAMS